MTSGGSRAERRRQRAERRRRPPGSSSSSRSLRNPSGSRRRHGAYGRRTAAPVLPPLRPPSPPWRPSGSAGPCPVPKRCWDSRGICGSRLPNFLGRTVSVHALLPRPALPSLAGPLPRAVRSSRGGQRCYRSVGGSEVAASTPCVREPASHSPPLTCLSPPCVCVSPRDGIGRKFQGVWEKPRSHGALPRR